MVIKFSASVRYFVVRGEFLIYHNMLSVNILAHHSRGPIKIGLTMIADYSKISTAQPLQRSNVECA